MILATAASILTIMAAQPEEFVDYELRPIRADAEALRPLVESDALRAFLDEVTSLEPITPRTVYYRMGSEPAAYRSDEMEGISEEEQATLRSHDVTTSGYYSTFYGSPLAYARALDLAVGAGLGEFDDKRIVDMGYGAITHLKLMAMCGADVTGIEVMPLLRAMYSYDGDQGDATGSGGKTGTVRLVHGYWPAEVGDDVGGDYDLFISRNTLKRGYINPPFETPSYQKVTLGVSDEDFIAEIYDALAPGGLAMIYNIGGGKPGEGDSYKAAADIANPFPQAQWEEAGFEIIAFDANDDEGARAVARALGWDKGEQRMNLDDLFGIYTIVRRPE